MSQTPPPSNEPQILGTLVSLLGVLAAFLYFTGWIYRWAYFSFFQVEVTTLDLPLESFFIVPFQVFLGNFGAISHTILAVVVTGFLVQLTLWLLTPPRWKIIGNSQNWPSVGYTQKIHRSWIVKNLRSLANLAPQPLRDEVVIVFWVLIVLFWLARWQGIADARRDAVNNTSSLPVVTLVTPKDQLALGRKPNDLLTNLPLEDFRIIGDPGLLENLRRREITDTTTNPPRVWRLLIERDGWIYLFQTLPPNPASNERPYVLVIRESNGGDQLLILSPETSLPRLD
ncbi:MAG: hypothetical protein F6K41_10120 [Symploca sp. SIO3E6]|nr:hypothetical protein [Caldora sp. SIO3E6]